jgi:hypothetical protein
MRATVNNTVGGTEELGGKPVPMPVCPPQIPYDLTQARSRVSDVEVATNRLSHSTAIVQDLVPGFIVTCIVFYCYIKEVPTLLTQLRSYGVSSPIRQHRHPCSLCIVLRSKCGVSEVTSLRLTIKHGKAMLQLSSNKCRSYGILISVKGVTYVEYYNFCIFFYCVKF